MKEKIKSARVMAGLSLREAAKLLGMSHQTIHNYESGKIEPDSNILSQFATAYNVKIDYFFRKDVEFGKIHWVVMK